MLNHINKDAKNPNRVIILGARGFVSGSVEERLNNLNIKIVSLSHNELDLTALDSYKKLSEIFEPNDTVFFAAAKAPVKNESMLVENILMSKNVCLSLKETPVKHLIYLSSDAVYADSKEHLTELSSTQPESLHGIMHYCREIMLKQLIEIPKCFIRPTLIFGAKDPHNGYGPNQFIRLSEKNEDIKLFGNGEELRDHVWIEDVSKIICNVFLHNSIGILNIASGLTFSFKDIAEKINSIFNSYSKIKYIPRNGPMPHDGYRSFNINLIKNSFSDFSFTSFEKAILEIKKNIKK
tara:strand:- start:493 stop:1374 length:882 start_codon:yes stop_codon:yes gene_type:complete